MNNLKHCKVMRNRFMKLWEAVEAGKMNPDDAIQVALHAEMTVFNWGSDREVAEQRKLKADALKTIRHI